MTAIGGSIKQIAIRGRNFTVASDADVTRSMGGWSNDVQSNGNGTIRLIKTMNPWALEGIAVSVDDAIGDHEYLQEIANLLTQVPISIMYPGDVVYSGKGQVIDVIQHGSNATTATLSLKGEGELVKQ